MSFVTCCVQRGTSTVTLDVTELAGGHNIALRVTAAIDSSMQMLSGTSKVSSLSSGEMEGCSENFH